MLYAGSRRLDIVTTIECPEREVLLRALFPLDVRSKTATFETMYGAHERPTHRNTSWDAARFEVSARRFADISEPGYGVTLLNDGASPDTAQRRTCSASASSAAPRTRTRSPTRATTNSPTLSSRIPATGRKPRSSRRRSRSTARSAPCRPSRAA
jgi:hypothetical protein